MRIPHSTPTIGPAEARAVAAVLTSGFVGTGRVAADLEDRFRTQTGRKHAFAVASGSHALALALRALDLPVGSKVALPVLTCPSVLAAVMGANHRPVLADIVATDLTLDAHTVGLDAAAIVAPHAYGAPVDVAAIEALGLPWIEDCATSPATRPCGRAAGASGTLATFSLGSTKYLTGGAGGAVVTNDDRLAARILDMLEFDRAEKRGGWSSMAAAPLPGRLSDVNAAMALVQMERLEEFAARRREIANAYRAGLRGRNGLQLPPEGAGHSYYRFMVRCDAGSAVPGDAMRERGIDVRTAVNPWLDQYATAAGIAVDGGPWPVAAQWRNHLLSLPIYPRLADGDLRYTIDSLLEVLDYARAA